MAVDGEEDSDNVSEAPEVEDDVSLKDIMRNINTLKKQQQHDSKRSREKTRVMIAEAVDPVWEKVHTMEGSVFDLSKGVTQQYERMEKMQTKMEAMKLSEAPRTRDPAYKRIVFKSIPNSLSADERLVAIEAFMEKHFKRTRVVDCANFYKGPYTNRSLSPAAYVEFSSSDVRKEVLNRIGALKRGDSVKIKCEMGGKTVEIKPAMTESAIQRNACLRNVSDVLKADERCRGKVVKIEFSGSRGVTVDKVYAFSQDENELKGMYASPFTDLSAP